MSKPEPTLPDEPDIFDEIDEEAEERALAEAEADIAAGRVAPHEKVAEWLASLGTPDEKPTPYSWRK